jgi:serine peptidase DegS
MPRLVQVVSFVAQSVAIGLAVAFIAVLVRPEIINRTSASAANQTSYAAAVAASAPAVANIVADRVYSVPRGLRPLTLRDRYLGSGVVIDRAGYVVTNWHVIKDADQLSVTLADGRAAVPKLVGTDPDTELALLKIDLPDLPEARLGRSDTLEVGEVVLAIGNSLGLSQTVTMGIVSATGRGLNVGAPFAEFIQTDAAINVGNSGGALVNTRGELVGINTAVISWAGERSAPEGLGFAIPINLVRGVMQQLIEHGRVIRGYLGVDEALDLSTSQAGSLGIDGSAVLITCVSGPAEAAGIRPGDVLTHINGQRMFLAQEAMTLVASSQPGESIGIRVVRPDGVPFETEAVLEERPLLLSENELSAPRGECLRR